MSDGNILVAAADDVLSSYTGLPPSPAPYQSPTKNNNTTNTQATQSSLPSNASPVVHTASRWSTAASAMSKIALDVVINLTPSNDAFFWTTWQAMMMSVWLVLEQLILLMEERVRRL